MQDRPVRQALRRVSERVLQRRAGQLLVVSPQAPAVPRERVALELELAPVVFPPLAPPERREAQAPAHRPPELPRAPPARRVDRFALARSECRWSPLLAWLA